MKYIVLQITTYSIPNHFISHLIMIRSLASICSHILQCKHLLLHIIFDSNQVYQVTNTGVYFLSPMYFVSQAYWCVYTVSSITLPMACKITSAHRTEFPIKFTDSRGYIITPLQVHFVHLPFITDIGFIRCHRGTGSLFCCRFLTMSSIYRRCMVKHTPMPTFRYISYIALGLPYASTFWFALIILRNPTFSW